MSATRLPENAVQASAPLPCPPLQQQTSPHFRTPPVPTRGPSFCMGHTIEPKSRPALACWTNLLVIQKGLHPRSRLLRPVAEGLFCTDRIAPHCPNLRMALDFFGRSSGRLQLPRAHQAVSHSFVQCKVPKWFSKSSTCSVV